MYCFYGVLEVINYFKFSKIGYGFLKVSIKVYKLSILLMYFEIIINCWWLTIHLVG